MEIALKLKPGEGLSAEEQKAIDEAQQKIEMDEKKKEVEEERTQAAWKALDKATGGKAGNRMDVDTVRALKLQIHALEKVHEQQRDLARRCQLAITAISYGEQKRSVIMPLADVHFFKVTL